jgi:hypothetical protein
MKDNKNILFQILSILLIVGGLIFGNNVVIIGGFIIIVLSGIFWFRDNLIFPIKRLEFEIKNLRKDLNIRKEIEDIKIKLENVTKK